LKDGQDIDYDGQSGPIEIDENGDPGQAVMGIYEYGADNTYARTGSEEGEVPAAAEE
jgi:branched-chain amino acid transport system substrate-binding protein